MILAIRTDRPEAEIGLFALKGTKIAYHTWVAHRELANTLLAEIQKLVQSQRKTWDDLSGIVVFQGPGSFTGLRIGITVANTFAYAQQLPIVGATGEEWIATGITRLAEGKSDGTVLPEYGAAAHITAPKK